MRRYISRFVLFLALATTLLVTLLSQPAHADTYAVYRVGNGNSEAVYGLTDSGIAVLFGADHCGSSFCYSTFTPDGMFVGTSDTAPLLPYDNGTPCPPALPPGVGKLGPSICNGGFAAFGTMKGLYGGPIGFPSLLLHSGSVDQLAVNAVGDFLWTDGRDEENFLAIDLTTLAPEPSTLALLGTGCLGVVGAVRRRIFQS